MDVLTDLLERSRARGAAFGHWTFHGSTWGLGFPAASGLAVHTVVAGEAWLWAGDAAAAVRLHPGDVALVRGALAHQLAHAPGAAARPLRELLAAGPVAGSTRRYRSGDPDAEPAAAFFCGAYLFDGDLCGGLLDALPDVIALRPAAGSPLRASTELLARELDNEEPGQQTLLDRLLDVALVQALRAHFGAHADAAPPWMRASADPSVGAALRALHGDPSRAWSVADLAAEAALSRAAFARRFRALLGVAPLTYLTEWRMALARERLGGGREPLAAIAASLGYASEFSFAAAFKREHGVAPGRWRAGERPARAASSARATLG